MPSVLCFHQALDKLLRSIFLPPRITYLPINVLRPTGSCQAQGWISLSTRHGNHLCGIYILPIPHCSRKNTPNECQLGSTQTASQHKPPAYCKVSSFAKYHNSEVSGTYIVSLRLHFVHNQEHSEESVFCQILQHRNILLVKHVVYAAQGISLNRANSPPPFK